MALSPYKSQENPLNRSRSSSFSSPIRNCVVYHEVYTVGANTLVRSYSCDQVFNKDETGKTFQTTQIKVSSFVTPEKNKYHNGAGFKESPVQAEILEPNAFKRKRLKVRPKEPIAMNIKKTRNVFGFMLKYFMVPTLISALTFYYFVIHKDCSCTWDLKRTENELKENVFGQNEALAKINTVLNMFNSTNDYYTLLLTGGVGVGKTYVSTIISRNFPRHSKKQISFSNLEEDIPDLFQDDFQSCGCNLLIVEDLSVDNIDDVAGLLLVINARKRSDEKQLTILIFQTHSESERSIILRGLKKSHMYIYHVPFKNLSEDAVRQCYEVEIKRQGVKIPQTELNALVKDKMSLIDIVKGPAGCKGISDDVAYYLK